MLCGCFVAVLAMAFLSCPAALAQNGEVPPLRLANVVPGGVRVSVTESWGVYDFEVTNRSDKDRLARVFVFFPDRPDVQYGREVWVPAHSALSSWMLVGPALTPGKEEQKETSREIHMLLYDRTEGKDRLVLPAGEERIRSRSVLYRRREPSTVLFLDEEAPEEEVLGQLPQPESRDEEALRLVRGFRLARTLSEYVPRVNPGLLPPTAEAFAGIDHFVLASNRIARDPAGIQALRHWLEQGGKVWVMLDRVDADILAPLLGDALDFQVIDRVSLTSFQIRQDASGKRAAPGLSLQQHDRPVEFARVLLPTHEQAKYTIDGWPVWFTRTIGRGKVVLSTLGARGWFRERTKRDPPSPYLHLPSFPIPTAPLEDLSWELHHQPNAPSLADEAFQPLLTEEIGYTIVGRDVVMLVFGVFLLTLLALGILLQRSQRPERLGWLAPAAALAATSIFVVLGETSRRVAPPTVAVAQVVEAVGGKEEAAIHGLMAMYRPDSGPVELGVTRGGFFEMNMEGLEGQTRRLVLADLDAWHWENLALPAGVRLAPFRATVSTQGPIVARARFGPEGIEGRVQAGPFEELEDLLLATPQGRNLAVQLRSDGSFRAGSQDILPQGQFLAGAVFTDRQQRRQELYREFLKPPRAEYLQERNLLLAWAKPIDMHFHVASIARFTGSALLVIPLRFERPSPGERVTIPGPFLSYQRILGGASTKPFLSSNQGIDMHLRFQLPIEVLPFQVERAQLLVNINAPSRRVTISGLANDQFVEVHRVDSPLNPIRIDLDARFLHLDAEGGLHVNLKVSDAPQEDRERGRRQEKWTIEYLELEVSGHT